MLYTAIISALVLACGQPAERPWVDTARPRAVVEFFMIHEAGWPGEYDDLKALIKEKPEEFGPVIAELLIVPQRLEEWDINAPREWPWGINGIFGHGLVQLLGREHADPILRTYFRDGYRLYVQATAQLEDVHRIPEDEIGPERRRERLETLWKQQQASMGMMSQSVVVAMRMKSPVVVDDMLKFWEAGYNDRQSQLPRYPLLFAHEREDIIPRLKAIMKNPATDRMVKHQIKSALDWYAATLAQADPGDPPLAEANSRPPGAAPPAPATDEGPR